MNGAFSICGDGSFVLLTKMAGDRANIWSVDLTSRNVQQLTKGEMDVSADCSPHDDSMIYTSKSPKGLGIVTMPIGGGSPKTLLDAPLIVGKYSPDGKQIGVWDAEGESRSMQKAKLAVIDTASGQVTRSFDVPPVGSTPDNSAGWSLRWTANGHALTYALRTGTTVNLWKQSVSGGQPRQITHFPDSVIAYAWSPDGKHFAVARRTSSRDVVLFSNFH